MFGGVGADFDATSAATTSGSYCIHLCTMLQCTEHGTASCKTCPTAFSASNRVRVAGQMSGIDALLIVNQRASVKYSPGEVWRWFTEAVVDEVALAEGWSGRRIAEKRLPTR